MEKVLRSDEVFHDAQGHIENSVFWLAVGGELRGNIFVLQFTKVKTIYILDGKWLKPLKNLVGVNWRKWHSAT